MAALLLLIMYMSAEPAPQQGGKILSGYILTQQDELLPNVSITVRAEAGELHTVSDDKGEFRLAIPEGPVTLTFEARNITTLEQKLGASDVTENLKIRVTVVIASIQESVVIQDTALNPTIDQRNDTVYKNTLMSALVERRA